MVSFITVDRTENGEARINIPNLNPKDSPTQTSRCKTRVIGSVSLSQLASQVSEPVPYALFEWRLRCSPVWSYEGSNCKPVDVVVVSTSPKPEGYKPLQGFLATNRQDTRYCKYLPREDRVLLIERRARICLLEESLVLIARYGSAEATLEFQIQYQPAHFAEPGR